MSEQMKHGGMNPEDFRMKSSDSGLTGNEATSYAKDGEMNTMPDPASGSPESGTPREIQDTIFNHKDQGGIDRPVFPDARSEAPFASVEQARDVMRFQEGKWKRENPGKELPWSERESMWNLAKTGWQPDDYKPLNPEGLILKPQTQAKIERAKFEERQQQYRDTGLLNLSGLDEAHANALLAEHEAKNRHEWDYNSNTPLQSQDPEHAPIKGFLKPRERDTSGYGEVKINSAEILAEEIMKFEGVEKWGTAGIGGVKEDGLFPLLQKYEIDGVVQKVKEGKEAGKDIYILNQENFLRWVRDRMMYWHGESADEKYNFSSQITIQREYQNLNLGTMINNASRYFRSEATGEVMQDLVEQIKRETWLFSESREKDIQYRMVMGSDEKLPEAIIQMFYGNTFTKTVWEGKSSLYWMMNLPEHFKQDRVNEKGEEVKYTDSNVGRAMNLAYQAYYNISDREMLVKLLGENAALLNATEIRNEIKRQAREDKLPFDDFSKQDYIDPKELSKLDTEEGLMSFINIFNMNGKPTRITRTVRKLIQRSIAEKYDLFVEVKDKEALAKMHDVAEKDPDASDVVFDPKDPNRIWDKTQVQYAETFALSMARWTGAAARNDTGAQGYDAWTRILVTDEYRKKQPLDARGGAYGNPYTVNMLKQLGTDFVNGTQVQALTKIPGYENSKTLIPKSTMEVLEEMQNATSQKEYEKAASQLVYAENTMRGFAQDHLGRTFSIFQQVMSGEDIKFDKFTSYDHVHGLRFDRAAFDQAVKEKFFKPMRYGYSTYSAINFGKMVRTPMIEYDAQGNKKEVYRTVRLAEAMFGRQIIEGLNAHIDPDKHWELFNPGKEDIKITDANWADKINWDFVNSKEGKVAMWRQVALSRIAAEFYAHKDAHSTDPKYSWWYYKEVVEVLEMLPNLIDGDEYDLKSSKAVGQFFRHHDIEWLRKASSTEDWKLYRQAIIADAFNGSVDGFKKALKLFIDFSFKGK